MSINKISGQMPSPIKKTAKKEPINLNIEDNFAKLNADVELTSSGAPKKIGIKCDNRTEMSTVKYKYENGNWGKDSKEIVLGTLDELIENHDFTSVVNDKANDNLRELRDYVNETAE